MNHLHSKQNGAALIVGLILLAVITLLAVVGMNISNTELSSATGEQLRLRAMNAAETGIEERLRSLREDATTSTVTDIQSGTIENSPLNTASGAAADTYSSATNYRGEGTMLSRYTVGTFAGFHYSVESTGLSSRNAKSVHTAGAFIVNSVGDANTAKEVDPDDAPVVALPVTP